MPHQTILKEKMRCADIDFMFSCFECIFYYFFKNISVFHDITIATTPPNPRIQSCIPSFHVHF